MGRRHRRLTRAESCSFARGNVAFYRTRNQPGQLRRAERQVARFCGTPAAVPDLLNSVVGSVSSAIAPTPEPATTGTSSSSLATLGSAIGSAVTGGSSIGSVVGTLLGETATALTVPSGVRFAPGLLSVGETGSSDTLVNWVRGLFGGGSTPGRATGNGTATAIPTRRTPPARVAKALVRLVGIEAASSILGISVEGVAYLATRPARRRGISARDIRCTRRTLRTIGSIQHALSSAGVCRRTYRRCK